jgi:hypothetical protein
MLVVIGYLVTSTRYGTYKVKVVGVMHHTWKFAVIGWLVTSTWYLQSKVGLGEAPDMEVCCDRLAGYCIYHISTSLQKEF